MLDPQVKVIAEVIQERKMQDRQWGGASHDDQHQPEEWFGFIEHQFFCTNFLNPLDIRERFVKIAAIAVAAAESIDRRIKNVPTE